MANLILNKLIIKIEDLRYYKYHVQKAWYAIISEMDDQLKNELKAISDINYPNEFLTLYLQESEKDLIVNYDIGYKGV
jgi:hypothetical protein